MLAPKMTGRAAVNVISPAFKNPMSKTEVALELCIMDVTATPRRADLNLLDVIFSRSLFSKPRDSFFNESLKR
jgi:hypothetical protein